MIKKKIVSVIIVVILFPLLPYFMTSLNEDHGLIWLFIEIVYYFPVSALFGEPLFIKTEIGALPSFLGRIVTSVIYLTLLLILVFLKKRLSKKRDQA